MASIRSFIGILRSRSTISSTKNVVTRSMVGMQQRLGQEQARRHFTAFAAHAPSNQYALYAALAAGLLTAAGVYSTNARWTYAEEPSIQAYNYQDVYDAIAERLIEEDDYDDGSYGPVVLRLAWHASGTYDAATGTGGSNGATMRFAPESEHGANSGLKAARDFLEPIKEQFPSISYSDLWTLSAVCAVQEVGGPTIPWRPGRKDRDVSFCSPDGMLPDGSKSHGHLRAIFGRMGFNDQEIVALSGAHALGRCHPEHSGFDGPWTFSPVTLTNDFYKLLIDEKWHERDWNGPRQFQDDSTKTLMMLPTDMALVDDDGFRPYVQKYAADQDLFFDDFSKAVMKLLELDVPFDTSEDTRIEFERTD